MGQVALELAYSLIIEGLCYGTGYLILRILGFRNLRPDDGAEPGAVLEVVQRGYRLGERVVRPARVIVAG